MNDRGQYARGGYGRGQYGGYGRGQYGVPPRPLAFVGRELSDEEIRKATEAGNRAVASLVEERVKVLREWSPSALLSREQMTTIMQQALAAARETEKNLVDMIAKVPSHWEAFVRREGGLLHLRQAIDEAPGFDVRIAKISAPSAVPEFRTWIDRLLSRSEDGVVAIAAVSDILPDWIRMRDILTGLQHVALSVINAVVQIGKAAVKVLGDPGKYLLIGGGVLAGVLTLVLVAKAGKK